jgi:CRP-like cAMP-binding protein
VARFIRYAQDAGEIAVPPGSEHWTRRRLILRPAFTERLRQRTFIDARAVARLAPEVASMADKLKDDGVYRRFLAWSSLLTTSTTISGTLTPTMLFMHRQNGMQILHHLMLAQAPDRTRMLEEAPISRNQLSQTFGVSRAHINRLLADAEAQGLLTCPNPTRVVFSPILSRDYERTRAFLFQISHAAYLTTLATEPVS